MCGDDDNPLAKRQKTTHDSAGPSCSFQCKPGSVAKPDGRQCQLCPRHDNDLDPVILAVFGREEFMKWCKPPLRDSGTSCKLNADIGQYTKQCSI